MTTAPANQYHVLDDKSFGDISMPSVFKRRGSRYWQCAYIDHAGRRRMKSLRTGDRRVAIQIAAHLENLHAQAAVGIIEADDIDRLEKQRQAPSKLLIKYEQTIQSPDWRKDVSTICRAFLRERGIRTVAEFGTRRIVEMLLKHLRAVAATGVQQRRIREYVRAIDGFGQWLHQNGYIRESKTSLARLPKATQERKLIHRALLPAELHVLSEFPGRGTWYLFLAMTGLRQEEAIRLEPHDLDLGTEPRLVIPAEKTKNGYGITMPITLSLSERLTASVELKTGRVFPATSNDAANRRRAFTRDMAKLKLNHDQLNGRSFRMTHKTWLQLAGVDAHTIAQLRRDVGGGSEKLRRMNYTDQRQMQPHWRRAVQRLERWYLAKVRAAACAAM